ncbi:MAG: SH3 domain-containing protein [Candidatus Accumulibacter sp.]|nr:SH3 domain-containing protein [Accumulibacter sp.]
MKRLTGLLLLTAVATPLLAVEYRSVDTPTVLYDAPSQKGNKVFVIRRGTPVEVVVVLEGWVKVRDADGGLSWIESKFLGKKRTLIVTASRAQIRQSADEAAAVVFEAEKSVALDFIDHAPGGWLKVRHRDGQSGFVRLNQVWGA